MRMRRNGLIEAGTMFNSTKPKTRPANYGASLAIDPEENPDGALRARDTPLSPSLKSSSTVIASPLRRPERELARS